MNVGGQILVSLKEYTALKKRLGAVEESTDKTTEATDYVLHEEEKKQQSDLTESGLPAPETHAVRTRGREAEVVIETRAAPQDNHVEAEAASQVAEEEEEGGEGEETTAPVIFRDEAKNARAMDLLTRVLTNKRVTLRGGIAHLDSAPIGHPLLLIAGAVESKKEAADRISKFREFLKAEDIMKRPHKKRSVAKRIKWKDFRLNIK